MLWFFNATRGKRSLSLRIDIFFSFCVLQLREISKHSNFGLKFVLSKSLPLEMILEETFFFTRQFNFCENKSLGKRRKESNLIFVFYQLIIWDVAVLSLLLLSMIPHKAQMHHETQTHWHYKMVSSGSHLIWLVFSVLISSGLGNLTICRYLNLSIKIFQARGQVKVSLLKRFLNIGVWILCTWLFREIYVIFLSCSLTTIASVSSQLNENKEDHHFRGWGREGGREKDTLIFPKWSEVHRKANSHFIYSPGVFTIKKPCPNLRSLFYVILQPQRTNLLLLSTV